MNYRYTVTKDADSSLAGQPARLVLMFEEGSALEVSLDDVVAITNFSTALKSKGYVNYSYDDGKRSCDCYGEVQGAQSFYVMCYEPEDDTLWTQHNTETRKPFKDWVEVLSFMLRNYCDKIELIEAIH